MAKDLVRRIVGSDALEERENFALSFDQFISYFAAGGINYNLFGGLATTLGTEYEQIENNFQGYVQQAFKRNGVIFATILVRMLVFKEARFSFRDISQGRPGKLFGTTALAPLEKPWTNGTTSDLLARAELDGSLAGNFYAARRVIPARRGTPSSVAIRRMRPDWTYIVLGTNGRPNDDMGIDTEVVGYMYQPGGAALGRDPIALLPEDVAHFAPIPDPEKFYLGMSWLSPIIDEIAADKATTGFKKRYMENAATPNMVVTMDITEPEKFQHWVKIFREEHEGVSNAYRTLFLKAGMDAKPIGSNLKEIDFKATQGGGEVRIAMAGGVPPSILGLADALEGSALSQGNYQGARRRFSDGTMRPLWRDICGTMQSIIEVPRASELWYDDRDIPFLQEDQKDAAEIQKAEASTINTLVTAGFAPDSAVAAVVANDFNLLQHTGLVSVQLLAPGEKSNPTTDPAATPAENVARAMALMRSRGEDERLRTSDHAVQFLKEQGRWPTNGELHTRITGYQIEMRHAREIELRSARE